MYSHSTLFWVYMKVLGTDLTKSQTPGCYTVGLMCTHLLHKPRDLGPGFLELYLFLIASPLFLVSCCHHHNIPEGTVWCVCVCVCTGGWQKKVWRPGQIWWSQFLTMSVQCLHMGWFPSISTILRAAIWVTVCNCSTAACDRVTMLLNYWWHKPLITVRKHPYAIWYSYRP